MTNPTCCKITGHRYFRDPPRCGKPGKVEVHGRWYCGIHNPARQEERVAAREAKWAERDRIREFHERLRKAERAVIFEVLSRDLVSESTLKELREANEALEKEKAE